MIAPSPIPQIQQGNISPAASLLGNTTSALMSRINQNRRSDAELLAGLIGQAGAGIREKLENKRTGEQGLNALRLAFGEGILPEDISGITPTSANTMIQAQTLPSQIRALKGITDIGESMADTGAAGSDQVLNFTSEGIQKLIGNASNPQTRTQDQIKQFGLFGNIPTVAPQPAPASGEQPVQQEDGSFSMGVSQNVAPEDQNLKARQARAKTLEKETQARDAITQSTSNPDFLYGVGNTGIKDINGTAKAVDVNGVELPMPMTKRLAIQHNNFNRLSSAKQTDVINNTPGSSIGLRQFVELGKNVIDARKQGTLNRQRLKLVADGTLDIADAQTPEEVAALTFKNEVAPLIISVAAADQGANSISNRDVEGIGRALGDPTQGFEVFVNSFSQFTAKGYLNALRNASSVDASTYNDLKNDLEELTGEPFDFDKDALNVPKIAKQIKKNLFKRKNQQGVTLQELQSESIVPEVQKPSAVQSGQDDGGDTLNWLLSQ